MISMYLPVTVTFRYTDILRGLVALFQAWNSDKTVMFTGPTAVQQRNFHNLLDDYESEKPMYATAQIVVDLLTLYRPNTIQEAYKLLLENHIVEQAELDTLQEWCRLVESFSRYKNDT